MKHVYRERTASERSNLSPSSTRIRIASGISLFCLHECQGWYMPTLPGLQLVEYATSRRILRALQGGGENHIITGKGGATQSHELFAITVSLRHHPLRSDDSFESEHASKHKNKKKTCSSFVYKVC